MRVTRPARHDMRPQQILAGARYRPLSSSVGRGRSPLRMRSTAISRCCSMSMGRRQSGSCDFADRCLVPEVDVAIGNDCGIGHGKVPWCLAGPVPGSQPGNGMASIKAEVMEGRRTDWRRHSPIERALLNTCQDLPIRLRFTRLLVLNPTRSSLLSVQDQP